MILLVCAEGEQMEEFDITFSTNDVLTSKNFVTEFVPNYSLSFD